MQPLRARRAAALSRGAAVLALFLTACQARAPRPDPGGELAAALGLDEAIELRIEPLGESIAAADAGHGAGDMHARLELAEALRSALRTSPELLGALARVQMALAEADQARLLSNPILDFVLRFPSGGGRLDIEAGLGQELLQYVQRPGRIRVADARLHAAVAAAVTTGLDVVSELRERYAAVQALDELTPLLGERQRTLVELTERARTRLAAGEASRLDVLALEAQALELELEIAERDAERLEQRLALARAIGSPRVPVEWELESWSDVPAELAPEEAWVAAALRHRPELAALRFELQALGDARALAGPAWLAGARMGVDAERDEGWALGPSVSVPLPLFDDGSARREHASAAVLAARAELVGAERRVVEEVRRAHAALRAAETSVARVRTELVPLQRDRRAQVQIVYLGGEADVTSVLLAEQDLQETQAKLVELEQKAAVSLARLERAVGGAGVARALDPSADDPDSEPEVQHERP